MGGFLCTNDCRYITTDRICESCLLERENLKQNKTMEQELTFGQKAVGLAFNPSGDDKVTNAKQLFADVIDNMIGDPSKDVERRTYLYNIIRTAGISACISASMAVVKFITWRD